MYEEDDTNYDANIAQICDFTGLPPDQALSLLKVNDNNVEVAINEYADKGAAAVPMPRLMPIAGHTRMPVSRRAGAVATAEAGTAEEEEEVRAPIVPQADILVDSTEARMLNRRSIKRPRRSGASAFDGFRNFAVETNRQEEMLALANRPGPNNRRPAHVRRLEDLFRPPLDIIFHGTFTTARSVCMVDGKWLMVNPQSPTEFSCQELNRDIWSDQAIKSIVQANFVFWQVYIDSEEGLAYHQYYPVEKFPYVSIIDPRTGELLKKWNAINKSHFAEQLIDFLQKHDTDKMFSMEDRQGKPSDLTSAKPTGAKMFVEPAPFAERRGASSDETQPAGASRGARGEAGRSSAGGRVAALPAGSGTRAAAGRKFLEERKRDLLGRRKDRAEAGERAACSTVTSGQQADAPAKAESGGEGSAAEVVAGGAVDLSSGSEDGDETSSDCESEGSSSKSAPDSIKLCVHLPLTGRKVVSFPASAKIRVLQKMLAGDGYPRKSFEYVLNFPKRLICTKEAGRSTFTAFGIAHNETVFVYSK